MGPIIKKKLYVPELGEFTHLEQQTVAAFPARNHFQMWINAVAITERPCLRAAGKGRAAGRVKGGLHAGRIKRSTMTALFCY